MMKFAKRMGLFAATAALAIGLSTSARADVALWYNGDFNGVTGLANEQNTVVSDARVYDNFVVTDAGGWTINSVYSNNLLNTGVTGAEWEIRSGVSAGNGGTLVASGSTGAPTVTATGRSAFGLNEIDILVTGLNVNLSAGIYWLMVAPIGDGTGRSFISTTSGANAIGVPPGNDDNSFFDSSYFGSNFQPASNFVGAPADFSMGVNGTLRSVPEPGSLALLSLGLVGGLVAYRRRRASAL